MERVSGEGGLGFVNELGWHVNELGGDVFGVEERATTSFVPTDAATRRLYLPHNLHSIPSTSSSSTQLHHKTSEHCRIEQEMFLASLWRTLSLAICLGSVVVGSFVDRFGERVGGIVGLVFMSTAFFLFSGEFFVTQENYLKQPVYASEAAAARGGGGDSTERDGAGGGAAPGAAPGGNEENDPEIYGLSVSMRKTLLHSAATLLALTGPLVYD